MSIVEDFYKPTTSNMPATFLSLPGEIRNMIYEYLLVSKEPIVPWKRGNEIASGLKILYTNKKIHREASSLMYANNRFNFMTSNPMRVTRFLSKIGRINASHIQNVIIAFPDMRLVRGEITIGKQSAYILDKIQSYCTNLKTLFASLECGNAVRLEIYAHCRPSTFARGLDLVDSRFKAISRLLKITVEVYDCMMTDDMRMEMESHGWIVKGGKLLEDKRGVRYFNNGVLWTLN